MRQQLAEIGLEVEVTGIPIHSASAAYFAKLGTPGEPWDLAFGLWCPSYIDPYAYINLLFDRRFLGATNFARFASSASTSRCDGRPAPPGKQAEQRVLGARRRLARDPAPFAAVDFLNEPSSVSGRVGCVGLRPYSI